jgi:hypothetical protein
MPIVRRRLKFRKGWTEHQRDALSSITGGESSEVFARFEDEDDCHDCWESIRHKAMRACVEGRFPGHRPMGWWRFDCPDDVEDFQPIASASFIFMNEFANWGGTPLTADRSWPIYEPTAAVLWRHGCMTPEELANYRSTQRYEYEFERLPVGMRGGDVPKRLRRAWTDFADEWRREHPRPQPILVSS